MSASFSDVIHGFRAPANNRKAYLYFDSKLKFAEWPSAMFLLSFIQSFKVIFSLSKTKYVLCEPKLGISDLNQENQWMVSALLNDSQDSLNLDRFQLFGFNNDDIYDAVNRISIICDIMPNFVESYSLNVVSGLKDKDCLMKNIDATVRIQMPSKLGALNVLITNFYFMRNEKKRNIKILKLSLSHTTKDQYNVCIGTENLANTDHVSSMEALESRFIYRSDLFSSFKRPNILEANKNFQSIHFLHKFTEQVSLQDFSAFVEFPLGAALIFLPLNLTIDEFSIMIKFEFDILLPEHSQMFLNDTLDFAIKYVSGPSNTTLKLSRSGNNGKYIIEWNHYKVLSDPEFIRKIIKIAIAYTQASFPSSIVFGITINGNDLTAEYMSFFKDNVNYACKMISTKLERDILPGNNIDSVKFSDEWHVFLVKGSFLVHLCRLEGFL